MSIVRVGLAETKKFAEGYEAIFGKKSPPTTEPSEANAEKKAAAAPAKARKAAKKARK